MKGTLIGAGVLLVLSGVLVFKGLRGLDKLSENIEKSDIPMLQKMLDEQQKEEKRLRIELDDYHRKLDEQIKETERLMTKLNECGIDPREIDIQLEPV